MHLEPALDAYLSTSNQAIRLERLTSLGSGARVLSVVQALKLGLLLEKEEFGRREQVMYIPMKLQRMVEYHWPAKLPFQ